jgi:carboxyl-terminal processing protease
MLDGNIGLLNVLSLEDAAVEQVKVKLKTLISAGAKKIVLDLRNCAEGKAENGGELANYFLKSGTIYYSQNKSGEKVQIVQARPELHISDEPLAVLIDTTTAGAAEIAAGALKDAGRATVIGEKSFGIGSVQKTIALKSGAVLTLSVAKYFTPNGKVIQDETASKTGIIPDIQAPDEEKHQDLAVESYYDDKEDAEKYRQLQEKIEKIQLDKAIEVLISGNAAKKAA